ncbi:hypothetical protein [Foetidibacter luteolus]|uniref:hypothetical protein n=1 Tax=Foetidibacter luteolus TaxID=2608880 RepID=UPI00129B873F|nr:hypothetical protein [Foetidibacter luteolus]
MKEYLIHIDTTKLLRLLQTTIEQLPKDYLKAYESFLRLRSKSFFRESLISKWIAIPTSNNVIFKNFDSTFRLKNIFVPTINAKEIEFQIYLNKHGIIGLKIGDDLENLIIDNIDASQFVIERVSTSKFRTNQADLEYIDDFVEIDEYLDNKCASEVFTIENVEYCSIITLSDKNCIAIDNNKSVYLLNKVSGLTKLIAKRPGEFVRAFQNKTLTWVFEL